MRRYVPGLLLLALLTGCMHVNDRQVVGSGEASFPLTEGDTYYHFQPVDSLLTRERAAQLTGPEALEVQAAKSVVDPSYDPKKEQNLKVRRVGHCYRVDNSFFISFLHIEDNLYLASTNNDACLELGAAGKHNISVVRIAGGQVNYVAVREADFKEWAHGLNAVERFWHDVEVSSTGVISVEDADAYVAFLESKGLDELTDIPSMYSSNVVPSAVQVRASQLLAEADRRKVAREAAAAQAAALEQQRAATAAQSYSWSSGSSARNFDPGDVVVLDTGWGMPGYVDVQVVSIRDEHPQIKVRHMDNGRTEWVSADRLKTADVIRRQKTNVGLTLLCVFATDPGKCAQEVGK